MHSHPVATVLISRVASGYAFPEVNQSLANGGGTALRSEHPIFITDRYGDRFDVTHAIRHYGMRASGFEFGIGT